MCSVSPTCQLCDFGLIYSTSLSLISSYVKSDAELDSWFISCGPDCWTWDVLLTCLGASNWGEGALLTCLGATNGGVCALLTYLGLTGGCSVDLFGGY